MKIKEIEHFEHSKLGYCIKEKLLPKPILNMFHAYGRKTHPYNTRNKDLPNIKRHKSDNYNKSFLCRSLHNYSTLKRNLQLSKSKKEFESTYKKQLFASQTLRHNQRNKSNNISFVMVYMTNLLHIL